MLAFVLHGNGWDRLGPGCGLPVRVPFPNIGFEPWMRARSTKLSGAANPEFMLKSQKLHFSSIRSTQNVFSSSSMSNGVISIEFRVGDELIWSTKGQALKVCFSNIIFPRDPTCLKMASLILHPPCSTDITLPSVRRVAFKPWL